MPAPLLVIRHASAGNRSTWIGDDRLRPLDDRGFAQAAELVETLAEYAVDRVFTSAYVRCVQTVEPLAAARGDLEVEETDVLAEGGYGAALESFLTGLRGTAAALCSHGDVIPEIVGHDKPCKKGSVWVVEWDGERVDPVRYIKPRN